MQIRNAFKLGASVEEIADITNIDPWFLQQIRYLVSLENRTEGENLEEMKKEDLLELKKAGFSDVQIAWLLTKSRQQTTEGQARETRHNLGLTPVLQMVASC